jgi:HEPN domain
VEAETRIVRLKRADRPASRQAASIAPAPASEVCAEGTPDGNIDSADLDEKFGMLAGATVLEALALELALKARLLRAGAQLPKWHSHSDLFALLPTVEQQDAEQMYQANRLFAMRATLAEVLDLSAEATRDGGIITSSQRRRASVKCSWRSPRWPPPSIGDRLRRPSASSCTSCRMTSASRSSIWSIEVGLFCGFFTSARASGESPNWPRERPDERVYDTLIDEAEVESRLVETVGRAAEKAENGENDPTD